MGFIRALPKIVPNFWISGQVADQEREGRPWRGLFSCSSSPIQRQLPTGHTSGAMSAFKFISDSDSNSEVEREVACSGEQGPVEQPGFG